MKKNIDYKTIVVTLPSGSSSVDSTSIKMPDGKIVGIAATSTGNEPREIINLSVLNNGNEVVRPADLSFSTQQSGAGFLNSMRPVDFDGGYEYNVRLTAYTPSRANDIVVQVIFAVVNKNEQDIC